MSSYMLELTPENTCIYLLNIIVAITKGGMVLVT